MNIVSFSSFNQHGHFAVSKGKWSPEEDQFMPKHCQLHVGKKGVNLVLFLGISKFSPPSLFHTSPVLSY